jgi:hypothetical protein
VPKFADMATTSAPVEEVWKLLYDPARFADWWEGIETVDRQGRDGHGDVTFFPDGYPDFPMPQALTTDGDGRRVVVSCLVSDLVFEWRLQPLGVDGADGSRIDVHVEIPEREAARLETQRSAIAASLRSLARLATSAAPPARG